MMPFCAEVVEKEAAEAEVRRGRSNALGRDSMVSLLLLL